MMWKLCGAILLATFVHKSLMDNSVEKTLADEVDVREADENQEDNVVIRPLLPNAENERKTKTAANITKKTMADQEQTEDELEINQQPWETSPLLELLPSTFASYHDRMSKREEQAYEPILSSERSILFKSLSSSTIQYPITPCEEEQSMPKQEFLEYTSSPEETLLFKSLGDLDTDYSSYHQNQTKREANNNDTENYIITPFEEEQSIRKQESLQNTSSAEGILMFKSLDDSEVNNNVTDYCSLGEHHTMCIYEPNGCKNVTILQNSLSSEDVQFILDKHNSLRHDVSLGLVEGLPAAYPGIPKLKWDNELAEFAQRWANQCAIGPDFNRRTERYAYVNQIMVWLKTDKPVKENTWKVLYDKWFMGIYKFTKEYGGDIRHFGHYKKKPPIGYNHLMSIFTQTVWADTLYVGCGQTMINEEKFYYVYQVCNYAPGGNIENTPIYTPKERPIR